MLTKVNHIGYLYFHKFKMDDGSIKEVKATKEDYQQLGRINPQNPYIVGGVWLNSYECLNFDTPDGTIGDNQYADIEGRYKFVRVGNKVLSAKNNEIVDNELTSDGLKRVQLWQ